MTFASLGEVFAGLDAHLADKRLVVTSRDAAGLEAVEVVYVGLPVGRSFMKRDKPTLDRPTTYQIQVPGELEESWSDWIQGMTITVESEGEGPPVTTLTGTIDRAALHGLLKKVRNLEMPLLAVNRVESRDTEQVSEVDRRKEDA